MPDYDFIVNDNGFTLCINRATLRGTLSGYGLVASVEVTSFPHFGKGKDALNELLKFALHKSGHDLVSGKHQWKKVNGFGEVNYFIGDD